MLRALAFAGIAFAVPAPVPAIPPPLPPASSAYGPLTQCFLGYRVAASAAEAVMTGDGVMLQTEGFILFLDPEPADRPASDRAALLPVPGLGAVRRFAVPADRTRPGLSRDGPSTEYVLPALSGAAAVLVRSPAFDGSARDLELLARIAPVGPAHDRCASIPTSTPEALYWSPVRRPGPLFHCQNGIGYAVAGGESLRLTWSRDSAWSRVVTGGVELSVLGPTLPARRIGRARGPEAGGYVATVNEQAPTLHVLVLAAPRSRVEGDPPYLHQISIQFAPGREAQARALASRLEFVGRDDPRCRPAQGGRRR